MQDWTYTYSNSTNYLLQVTSSRFAYCDTTCPQYPSGHLLIDLLFCILFFIPWLPRRDALTWVPPTSTAGFSTTVSCYSDTLKFTSPASLKLQDFGCIWLFLAWVLLSPLLWLFASTRYNQRGWLDDFVSLQPPCASWIQRNHLAVVARDWKR